MPKQELTTTLNAIRACAPCKAGWETLLQGLGKTKADDEPFPLTRIFEANGVKDAIWALRSVAGADNAIRLFSCACARYSLDFFEWVNPDDKRPRRAIETSESFARNKATLDELAAADAAAWAADAAAWAADAAAWDAAKAAAWAAKSAAWAAAGAAAWAADAAAWAAAGAAAWAADAAAWDAAWGYFEKEFLLLCALEGGYGEVD